MGSRYTCSACLRRMEDEQDRGFLSRDNLHWEGYLYVDGLLFHATSCEMSVLGFYLCLRFSLNVFSLVFTLLPFGGCLANTHGSTMWILYTLLSVYDTGLFYRWFCISPTDIRLLSLSVSAMVILMAYPTIRDCRWIKRDSLVVT